MVLLLCVYVVGGEVVGFVVVLVEDFVVEDVGWVEGEVWGCVGGDGLFVCDGVEDFGGWVVSVVGCLDVCDDDFVCLCFVVYYYVDGLEELDF